MKRRRRCGASGDSLELLLDTICNTFGGIVFIALLVVLTLKNSAPVVATPEHDPAAPAASAEELERAAARLGSVTAELASLRTARADLAKRAESFAPDDLRQLLADRNALAAAAGALRSERDRQTAANAAAASEIARNDADLSAAAKRAAALEGEAARLEADLRKTRDAKVRELRNPLVRPSPLTSHVTLVVRYGRMYVWHRYGGAGERLGLNTDEFVVVAEDDGSVTTRPDPTKGVPLSPAADAAGEILRRLRPFPPERFWVTAIVRTDSFDRFPVLRDTLAAAGYQYRLMPSDGAVFDRGGTDSRVQ